ncbi:MAG: DUF983 domain-containing protein [Planctomycetaceae bacterium]|nr:DUF983 domain-containing protein [Planctomycetaceae bacterium]
MARALWLRCPRCGTGALFRKGFRMFDRCPDCDLNFNRAPGYYLGSTYINYGMTAVTMTALFLILQFGLNMDPKILLWVLMAYCVLLPIVIFRHARAFWLALDCHFDKSVLIDEDTQSAVQ